MLKLLGAIAFALLATLSGAAGAFLFDPCQFAGQSAFLPSTIGPNDQIGYRVAIPHTLGLYSYPDYQHIWVTQSRSQSDPTTFVVDVILTNDPTTFPNYHPVGAQDQNWGFFGPLDPGPYTVLGSVEVFDASTGGLQPACDPQKYGGPQRASPVFVFSFRDPNYQSNKAVGVPVIEYYDAALDQYFMTMSPTEIQALDSNQFPGWIRTGQQFLAYATNFGSDSSTYVARFYGLPSAGLDSHFLTVSTVETQYLLSAPSQDWVLETLAAFEIWQPLTATGYCPIYTLPVYRLWNGRADTGHRYTTDPLIRQAMITKGYVSEGYGPDGVVMCAPSQ